jgi:hypothetical protein
LFICFRDNFFFIVLKCQSFQRKEKITLVKIAKIARLHALEKKRRELSPKVLHIIVDFIYSLVLYKSFLFDHITFKNNL